MRGIVKTTTIAAALSILLGSTLEAQARRADRVAISRRAASAVVQDGEGGGMTPTIYGGIATGEGGIDLGFALSASLEWDMPQWPVNLRIDPYVARHGGNCGPVDCDLTVIGVGAAAAYRFDQGGAARSAAVAQDGASALVWFIFGGLGLYNSNFSADYAGFGGSASSTDLGVGIGGGADFGERFRAEARYYAIDYFSPIALLFGIRF